MKPVSRELETLLATRQFYAADLYVFSGGNLGSNDLRYCGGDRDIVANGFTYLTGGINGPFWDRTDNKAKCHWKIGVEVDTLVFDMLPGTSTIFGATWSQAVRYGLFDGAELLLEKAYMPTYGDTSRGTMIYFFGRVANVDVGRSILTFTVNSHLELLNTNMPHNLYQPGCVNNLGDTSCGVDLTSGSYHTTGTVSSGSTIGSINTTLAGGPFAAGAFDLGAVTMTSGVLNGLARTVKTATYGSPNVLQLIGFFPTPPANGDTLSVTFGCDKTDGANGCAKFANTARYRGFPFVPQPIVAS